MWIYNTKPSIRLTKKWSHRWITLHNDDDYDHNDNYSDNAYWHAAIFREESQRAGHYSTLVLMMVCFCAKSEKWAENNLKCTILIMNHVITELKLSWAILVLCPHFPQAYICTHAKLPLSDLVEDSKSCGKIFGK